MITPSKYASVLMDKLLPYFHIYLYNATVYFIVYWKNYTFIVNGLNRLYIFFKSKILLFIILFDFNLFLIF